MIQGALLGVSVAVAPGPLQAYLLAQTRRYGARRTWPLILAPVVSDIPIIALVLLALAWLPEWALRGLQVAGGLLLLYMAYEQYVAHRQPGAHAAPPQPVGGTFLKAVLLNALSPGPYVFWTTIAGPLFWRASAEGGWLAYLFLASFGVALVAGLAIYVALSSGTRHLDERYQPMITALTIGIMAVFGVYQVYAGVFIPASVALAR
ncbi:MAG: LysE family transporter [Anaerolineales bacterium]|nr:LysE family transporter [Anaerolineales bacterium]